jgi:hypothetical protein
MQPPTPSGAAASTELAPAVPSSSVSADSGSASSSIPAVAGSSGAAGSSGSSADKGVNAQVLQRYKELLLQTEERCRTAERQASLSGEGTSCLR